MVYIRQGLGNYWQISWGLREIVRIQRGGGMTINWATQTA